MGEFGEKLFGVEVAKYLERQRKGMSDSDDLSGIGTAALAVLEQRQRAEKAEAEVARLRAALHSITLSYDERCGIDHATLARSALEAKT